MNEKVPESNNSEEFSVEELIDIFGDDQKSFNGVVTTVLQIADKSSRESKIEQLKLVAEKAGLDFPTEEDIQRKRAEFASENSSQN